MMGGLVMAGGRGSRMQACREKLMLGRTPMVLRVLDAMVDSGCFSRVSAVTSPNAPQTAQLLRGLKYHCMESNGDGYSMDLSWALQRLEGMVLVVSADMPLLDNTMIQDIVRLCGNGSTWTSVLVSVEFTKSLGLVPGHTIRHDGTQCCHAGISMVDASRITGHDIMPEHHIILDDRRVAFNLNTRRDCNLLDGF